ncbi:VOC family protein [Stappia sp.]|uniref:VOC family protein n=1 Tax=Stappia sp. TaxID=1870903 RepID=UPI0032D933CE
MPVPHGVFYWNELMTRDPDGAKAFYEGALGWTFEGMPDPEGGTYWLAMCAGVDRPVCGIFTMSGPKFDGVTDHWMPYIAVDDVDARSQAAVEHGATLLQPPFDVPGIGRIAVLKEPGGAVVGWMTPVDQEM